MGRTVGHIMHSWGENYVAKCMPAARCTSESVEQVAVSVASLNHAHRK